MLSGSVATTVDEIVGEGGAATGFIANLALPEGRPRLVTEVTNELGPIDILVNNAAVTWFEPVDDFDIAHYEMMFAVQVRAPFQLAQAVLPGMRERKRGWILNISSGAARHPQGPPYDRALRGGTVYGMCKAALERFTTGLAAEAYTDSIAVNVLSPAGLVPTPGVVHHGLDRMIPSEQHEPPEVMAAAALALCSGDPARLTGRVAYSQPLLDELEALGSR
jgi:NAD(P)-dependent dehydrogenase (short-subunit alcohol dehydrogenase family)